MRRLILLTFIFCFALLSCKDQKNTVTSTNDQLETLKGEKGHDGKPDGYSSYENNKDSSASTQSHTNNWGTSIYGPVTGSVSSGKVKQLLYKTPSYYSSGYIYTAVLRSTSGDADLHMYQQGSFRKLEERERPSSEDDVIRFTTTAFQGSPTRIDLDAIGNTNASYEFELYRKSTTLDIILEFPLNRDTDSNGDWWTASSPNVTAVLDLDTSVDAIQIRNAQEGTKSDGCLAYNGGNEKPCSQVTNPDIKGFKTSSGNDWNVSWVNYDDAYSTSGHEWL